MDSEKVGGLMEIESHCCINIFAILKITSFLEKYFEI